MALIGLLFVALSAFLIAVAFYNFYWKRRNLPPGPTPLPLVGNLHVLHRCSGDYSFFLRWAERYGPTYTFWIGEQPVVMVTDHAQIIDAFVRDGDAFAGRGVFSKAFNLIRGGIFGVIQTEGEVWREHRRFALHVFRDFGVGKSVMQDKILAEIGARFGRLDDEVAATPDSPINIAGVFDMAVGSIINDLLFGYRFDGPHAAECDELKEIIRQLIIVVNCLAAAPLAIWPQLFRRLPYFSGVYSDMLENMNKLDKFYGRQIDAHERQMALEDPNAEPTDYVGAFLRERQRRQRDGDGAESFSRKQLMGMCFDLWLAGQETTSITLGWMVAYVLHNPEVQSRLHAELDTVIGDPDRLVTVADKPNLPYVNAVVNETQRMANIVLVNLMHRTTRAVTVGGYHLPEGSIITPQISTVLSNDKYFSDAGRFDPSRFLDSDGRLAKCDQLIPFSVGKRQCLGEPLARMELFLFTANLFNRYTVLPSAELPSMARKFGDSMACLPYRCRLRRRQQ